MKKEGRRNRRKGRGKKGRKDFSKEKGRKKGSASSRQTNKEPN